MARWIWYHFFPPNISSFLWRMLLHALPIDSRVQSRGIVLAFGCRCCRNHEEENLRHIFILSEVASAVWKCFGEIFHLTHNFQTIHQALATWMDPVTPTTQYGVVRLGVATYIFREILVARSRATFEGDSMSARAICLKVLSRV